MEGGKRCNMRKTLNGQGLACPSQNGRFQVDITCQFSQGATKI